MRAGEELVGLREAAQELEGLRAHLRPGSVEDAAADSVLRRLRELLAGACRARDETPGEPERPAAGPADDSPKNRAVLRPREREVLHLLAEGFSSKQIAHQLHISIRTVETHRRNIGHKLKLHSVAELTKYAIREGLATLES